MARSLESLRADIEKLRIPKVTPHGDNLLHQIKSTARSRPNVKPILQVLVPAYVNLVSSMSRLRFDDLQGVGKSLARALDIYFALARNTENDLFISQSDFKTSIIPEFFLRIAHNYITTHNLPFVATGQVDLAIEIAFDIKRPRVIVPRMQRVDFAIVKPIDLRIGQTPVLNFSVPLIAAEVKTYFDKNMITGVAYSVAALKSTFPHCVYLAIGEFADFELSDDSFASSEIDEIFILRRQKRSAFRRSKIADATSPDLVTEIANRIVETIKDHTKVHTDLKLRMPQGRLILGNPEL